jgi:hypothetical protein
VDVDSEPLNLDRQLDTLVRHDRIAVPPGREPDYSVVGVNIDGEDRLVVRLRRVIPQPRRDPALNIVTPPSGPEPERCAGRLVFFATRIQKTPAKAYGQS